MASSYRRLLLLSRRHLDGPESPDDASGNPFHHLREIACAVIGVALFLAVLYMIISWYFLRRRNTNNNLRTRNPSNEPPILLNTREDFVDEEYGPQLDHPIWYIRTIGLDRSVIDSITIFKYKAGERLIDGTECSVCLSEFREDDSLRLLPKCSHAFHIPCIDPWLRSHQNCPLCRAPIVIAGGAEQASLEVPSAADSGSNGLPEEEDLDNGAISVSSSSDLSLSQIGELGASENEIEGGKFSALPDPQQVLGREVQPVKRSVSMDSPSASGVYRAVAVAMRDQGWGASKKLAVKMKSFGPSTNQISSSCGSGSSGLFKMVKSCSFGAALDKEPIPMPLSTRGDVRSFGQ